MLYKLDKYDINILEKAMCSTCYDKFIEIGENKYIEIDKIIETIDKLNSEFDRLMKTYKKLEEQIKEVIEKRG